MNDELHKVLDENEIRKLIIEHIVGISSDDTDKYECVAIVFEKDSEEYIDFFNWLFDIDNDNSEEIRIG